MKSKIDILVIAGTLLFSIIGCQSQTKKFTDSSENISVWKLILVETNSFLDPTHFVTDSSYIEENLYFRTNGANIDRIHFPIWKENRPQRFIPIGDDSLNLMTYYNSIIPEISSKVFRFERRGDTLKLHEIEEDHGIHCYWTLVKVPKNSIDFSFFDINNVNWKELGNLWNVIEAQPETKKLKSSFHKIDTVHTLDLREVNQQNFLFKNDTLFYTSDGKIYKFLFFCLNKNRDKLTLIPLTSKREETMFYLKN